MNSEVKIGMLIAATISIFFLTIGGAVTADKYLTEQTTQKCIDAGKVWTGKACVDNTSDLRYIDND
ncbi:hypothetical protein SEA_TOMAS_217 [Streptomyces phage Tomas]|uniref:Uncharacterized protein n=1 Tax=Streptomyces phage Tomas TaxID=2914443 RepID=A0AA49BS63_9CAUD|nr:hypothetical protein PP453_gp104 [Streptomyces phage Tomas]UMO76363.1 hypothetical protein SEA_TOMAS_217 [Streptomyces phage Tomas]